MLRRQNKRMNEISKSRVDLHRFDVMSDEEWCNKRHDDEQYSAMVELDEMLMKERPLASDDLIMEDLYYHLLKDDR